MKKNYIRANNTIFFSSLPYLNARKCVRMCAAVHGGHAGHTCIEKRRIK